jgi:crotonobetainyl-CoA:carnitine CoA-transferase CaiB-like acyl-CoA transferase
MELRKGSRTRPPFAGRCTARSALAVETELNAAQIGCARVFNMRDQYVDEHYNAREMTVPVLDRQSGVPIRVYGVVPKMSLTSGRIWRGAPAIGEDMRTAPCIAPNPMPLHRWRLFTRNGCSVPPPLLKHR